MTLPRFLGEASLYKTAAHYRLAAIWNDASESQWVPAQLFQPGGGGIGGGPKGCTNNAVDVSICPTGCQRVCNTGTEITETCVSSANCPGSLSCGQCLLPTGAIRAKILAGLPIDPSTDLLFSQTCQQGSNTFTRPCEICSEETRISLPIVSDKCIRVCMSGFDPSSIRVVVRDC
jgi:hypothetical protein